MKFALHNCTIRELFKYIIRKALKVGLDGKLNLVEKPHIVYML